ncbi:MAG: hypothetical protein BYD32DRAFT_477231 [Podila humilis]|nr:MAG: hypothetical protein BYD32DRAFT_477231 [Podila humilis]
MPGLQELSLANLVVDASALVFFETICARLRVLQLYARRVDISDSIKTSAPWTIQELLISEYCHIDAVAFTARCPDLEVFEFCTKDEPQKCQSFAQYLDSGALPRLKHLDLSVVTRSDEETASFIMGMRCLRKFKTVRLGSGLGHGLRRYGLSELEYIMYVLLERISHLEALEELWIAGGTPELIPGKGLELLVTLQRLRELHLQTDLWPILHMDTAQWIRCHLKALEKLCGSWKIGSRTTRDSVMMLREYTDIDVNWKGDSEYGEYDSP